MLPLATQVHSGRYGWLSAAQGHRDRAWGPRVTSLGAYGELTGAILKKSLLYTTKQYKTTEEGPASYEHPVSTAACM